LGPPGAGADGEIRDRLWAGTFVSESNLTTLVTGRRPIAWRLTSAVALANGEEIRFGVVPLRFRAFEAADSTRTPPAPSK
jgi:hypothetical protein